MFSTLGVIYEMENGKSKQKIKEKLLEKQKKYHNDKKIVSKEQKERSKIFQMN